VLEDLELVEMGYRTNTNTYIYKTGMGIQPMSILPDGKR